MNGSASHNASAVMVLDVADDQPLGQVINASRAGLLTVSARSFAEQERAHLRLVARDGPDAVELSVEAVYCESSPFSDRFGVGFAIVEIHDGELETLFPQIGRARFGVSA